MPVKTLILPEDVSGRFLDFNPNHPGSVYQDYGKRTAAQVDGDKVGNIACSVSGVELIQAASGSRMSLFDHGSLMSLWSDTTQSSWLYNVNLPEVITSKLRAPLTIAWWIRPEVVVPAGAPQYHWEFYNRIEGTIHLNAQYNDPNDASNHKRFTFSRRRNDTTGSTSIATRVDDALYPNASIGTWVMLAMTHTGSPRDSQYFQYLNGVRIGSATGVAALYTGFPVGSEFWFGTRNVAGNFAKSKILRWVAWNRELTNSELLRLWWTTRNEWDLV